MNFGKSVLVVLSIVATAGAVGGCSLLYQPREQCSVDSDCVRLSRSVPGLVGTYCEEHVCSLPRAPSVDCQKNSDCIALAHGDPAICRDFTCVPLQHGACQYVINAEQLANSEDVIVMGAFDPMATGGAYQATSLYTLELAASEMQQRKHGAIGFTDSTVRRPFVFVVCDIKTSAAQLQDSFDHLTKTLRVPVAITTFQPLDLSEEWSRLAADPNFDTMFISPFATDSSLRHVDSQGRIWNMLGDPVADLADGYLQVIRYQLARVAKAQPHILMVTNDRVAMLDLASAVETKLPLGMSVQQARESNIYRRVYVPLPAGNESPTTSEVEQALADLDPDVIIVLGGEELIKSAIENAELGATPRYYVLSQHLAGSESLELLMPTAGSATSLDKRLYALNYAGAKDRTVYAEYLSDLQTAFPLAVAGFENFYDAAYFAMLSVDGVASRTPTGELRGSKAATGFQRLIDVNFGKSYRLVPGDLVDIVDWLERQPSSLAVTGAMGPPNFSLQTGARQTGASAWCFARDPKGEARWQGDVVRYEQATGSFDADLASCHTWVDQ